MTLQSQSRISARNRSTFGTSNAMTTIATAHLSFSPMTPENRNLRQPFTVRNMRILPNCPYPLLSQEGHK